MDDIKDYLRDTLAQAIKEALADKIPMVVGVAALALVFSFLAGRFSK